MSKPTLSIIIPCFNCSSTLKEAVDSCFTQGLENFEIILVNDSSTDNTQETIELLAKTHSQIKVFSHDKNKGGGATRNTGISHALSDTVFCLDSDDILPPNTLSKMLAFLHEKNCDGVGVNYSKKFKAESINNIERIDTFGYVGASIPFESLLEKNNILCPLYSTFMHTKKAFEIAEGYPTYHGFDTQGFAWRFLGSGLVAYTCPETEYLHRLPSKPSYYIREYRAGRINYNWYCVLSEFLYVFKDNVKKIISDFDFYSPQNLFQVIQRIDNPLDQDFKLKGKETALLRNRPNKFIYNLLRIKRKLQKYLNLANIIVKNRNYNPLLLFALVILKFKKILKIGFEDKVKSNIPLDIVIPTISKDYELLELGLEAIKKNLLHPIGNIYIVSNKNNDIEKFCEDNGLIFIDEKSVLGFGKEAIEYKVNNRDRSGWMYQQLLKLSGEKFVKLPQYLVVDSDTILIQPHVFIKNNKFIFLQSEEWHTPYFSNFRKIFGYTASNFLSYTSHMMIFDVNMLKEMKAELEKLHNIEWYKEYCLSIDSTEPSCISDYDTYANWLKIHYSEKTSYRPFYNLSLERNKLLSLDDLAKRYGKKYKSLSFHAYSNTPNYL